MKPDTERTKRYFADIHTRKSFLHIHVSKTLRSKLKAKRRAILVRKGDKVRVMRGFARGQEAKVLRVDYIKLKIYLEGITDRTARGREVPVPLEASNLLLLEMESTPERQQIFGIVAPAAATKSTAVTPVHPSAPATDKEHKTDTSKDHIEHKEHKAKGEHHG